MRRAKDLPCLLHEMAGTFQISFLIRKIRSLHQRLSGPVVLPNASLDRHRLIELFECEIDLTAIGVDRCHVTKDSRPNPGAKRFKEVEVTALGKVGRKLRRLVVIRGSCLQIALFLTNLPEIHQGHCS